MHAKAAVGLRSTGGLPWQRPSGQAPAHRLAACSARYSDSGACGSVPRPQSRRQLSVGSLRGVVATFVVRCSLLQILFETK